MHTRYIRTPYNYDTLCLGNKNGCCKVVLLPYGFTEECNVWDTISCTCTALSAVNWMALLKGRATVFGIHNSAVVVHPCSGGAPVQWWCTPAVVVHPCSGGTVFVAVLTLDAECHDHYFPSLPGPPLQSKLLLDTGPSSTGIID